MLLNTIVSRSGLIMKLNITQYNWKKPILLIGMHVLMNCLIFAGGSLLFATPVDSLQSQSGIKGLWNLEDLYKSPSFKWLKTENGVSSLAFKSVDYKGNLTEVFAYYSNPDMLTGKISQKKFPGVVLLHGGGGKAFSEWVEKWAAEGYAAIAIDFGGMNGEGKRLVNAGPEQDAEAKFKSIATGSPNDVWTYHSVASAILAHSWLRSQPKVDSSLTFVTGISWGGYLTCIVGSVDNRFKAAVPVYGCGYYGESDIFKNDLNQLTTANREKWLHYFDPSVYLPNSTVKFLFINGNRDRFYNVLPYHKSYSLVNEKNRNICIKPDMKHSHPAGWEPLEIRSFFDQIAFGYAELPMIHNVAIKSGEISASYIAPVSIASSSFYYTTDTVSLNENRKWHQVKAVIDSDNHTISCPLPEDGFNYGFFSMKDHRNLSASSEFIFKSQDSEN